MTQETHSDTCTGFAGPIRWALLLATCVLAGCASTKDTRGASAETSGPTSRYNYTHVYLRQLFFLEPKTLLFAIKSEGPGFLRDIWVKDVGGDPALAEQIDCKVVRDDAIRTVAVIAPPRPVRPTDAYLIGLVLQGGNARYFTFEKIRDINGTGIEAVLCEWTASKHQNHNLATAKPTLQSFVSMIDRAMAGEI